ncbi:Uma2 family endonuclease [Sandaracinobacteroides saxicola]|uniref:Uma2 family endonuclease n=1 Tax=Sandaracinobacteroides saxicola TaxID=2759707 RepID=A0A7G5IFT8_9SPHN|nr:Uma2 family endonuclease [Sandaracinobacteroides saxicola]QMW22230.1 Uma2 family endonuclease [Sandaracinobacteroides saxicola]
MNALARDFAAVRPARFNVADYLRMADAGLFSERRVDLVDGELVEMAPAQSPHGMMHADLTAMLWALYKPNGFDLCLDIITVLPGNNVRAPDIGVRPRGDDGRVFRFNELVLAVEIADSSLSDDLGSKAMSYAKAGIPTYWVVDVSARVTHVLTTPEDSGYANRAVVPFAAPLTVPGVESTLVIG